MRTITSLTLAVTATLALGACGDGGEQAGEGEGPASLTQAQTETALLTDEEFPLEGWTRGEVGAAADGAEQTGQTEQTEQTEGPEAGRELGDALEGAEGVSEECLDAMTAIGRLDESMLQAGSQVTFSGPRRDAMLPQEAELLVGVVEDGSPLESLDAINEHCEEVEISEGGMTATLSFREVDGVAGSAMSMDVMGMQVEAFILGQQDGTSLVAMLGTGLEEEEAKQVLQAQVDKVADIG